MPRPARPADSSARVVVVPTATTRRDSRFAQLMISRRRLTDGKTLGRYRVGLDLADTHRLKRSVADMQRDRGALNPALLECGKDLGSEVQPGRRRRYGSSLARVHGLITLPIVCSIVALDVRGQRHMADVVDGFLDARLVLRPEANRAPSVKVTPDDLRMQDMPGAAEHHLGSGLQLLPGMDERLPFMALDIRKEQAFDGAAARYPGAEKPGGKDSGVVDDEQIAVAQKLGQPGHI